jgi:hypothetical protein
MDILSATRQETRREIQTIKVGRLGKLVSLRMATSLDIDGLDFVSEEPEDLAEVDSAESDLESTDALSARPAPSRSIATT